MKKDKVVQFVCFVTNLKIDEFMGIWESYAKRLGAAGEVMLQETASVKGKNKFRYVSQHSCDATDFRFVFMKGRNEDDFPEHNGKVINAGGYSAVQMQCHHNDIKNDVKVMAFLDHRETDLDFFYQQTFRHLNIYEAYYESCTYSYILEYFVQEADAALLVEQLKTRAGIEAAVYKESAVITH